MAIHKTGGTTFHISPTTVDPDTLEAMDDAALLAFYEGLNDWVEVEETENLGDVGDTAETISFQTIGRNRVRKLKGPRNAGAQTVVVGRDPLDDGQEALITAEKTDFNYPFKMVLPDARTASYTDSVQYYAGLVMSRPTNLGPNAQVTTRTFTIEINTSVLEVASELISS
jgi:hypothetical protein